MLVKTPKVKKIHLGVRSGYLGSKKLAVVFQFIFSVNACPEHSSVSRGVTKEEEQNFERWRQ
jgi:hypothetical protein